MALITDFFGKASIDTDHSVATTVTADRTAGVTVLSCFDLSTFTEDTPVYFVTYTKATDPVTSEVTITNLVSWKGLANVGANTITNLTVAPGYVDAGNVIGQFVECIPTSYWSNELVEGIQTSLNPDGTLKNSIVTPAMRTGGFKVGQFTPSAGTGNKSVTGVGFQPKGVIFFGLVANTSNHGLFSGGAYDGSNQFNSAMGARITATSGNYTTSQTTACIRVTTFSGGAESVQMLAAGVSLDADGFTLNFTTNGTPGQIGYIAFA